MNSKIYRCGYCGIPTDENANPLEGNISERVINIIDTYGDERTHKNHGLCCIYDEIMRQEQMVQVSRDMAHDAGMPEIEGTWIKW